MNYSTVTACKAALSILLLSPLPWLLLPEWSANSLLSLIRSLSPGSSNRTRHTVGENWETRASETDTANPKPHFSPCGLGSKRPSRWQPLSPQGPVLPRSLLTTLKEALWGRHHSWPRVAARTYHPAGFCWAATKFFPMSSEQPPGRPKLNKGLLESVGAAACPAWALHLQEGL